LASDAVGPGPQETAGIVTLKTPPQLKMNVLAQVAALCRVSLIGAREPSQGRAVFIHCVPVQVILAPVCGRDELDSFHTQGSRWDFFRLNRRNSGCRFFRSSSYDLTGQDTSRRVAQPRLERCHNVV